MEAGLVTGRAPHAPTTASRVLAHDQRPAAAPGLLDPRVVVGFDGRICLGIGWQLWDGDGVEPSVLPAGGRLSSASATGRTRGGRAGSMA
jgi:hypothetical protein